jgi:hypothetical protein
VDQSLIKRIGDAEQAKEIVDIQDLYLWGFLEEDASIIAQIFK